MKKQYIDWWTGGASFTSEYQAILDRATTLGYTQPSAAQKTKENNLIVALKAAGIWTSLDLFYNLYTDGDASYAKLNWKTPASYPLNGTGHEPTFASLTGFSASNNNWFATGWNPSTNGVNYTQNSSSIFMDVTAASGHTCGCSQAANFVYLNINADGVINSGSPGVNIVGTGGAGTYQLQRSGATTVTIFKNGASIGTNATASLGRPNDDFSVMAFDSGAAKMTGTMRCLATGASLSGLESAFHNAWTTFKS